MAVKNFQLGLEWMWERQKFIERKSQISEYYLDFKDDGVINTEKFKVLFHIFTITKYLRRLTLKKLLKRIMIRFLSHQQLQPK